MGFFSFLRRKSVKVEPPATESVKLKMEELDSWLDSHFGKKFDFARSSLLELREQMEKEKSGVGGHIENLRGAELKNKDIPDRVKQIMEGNRETYAGRLESFLAGVSFPERLEDVKNFSDSFEKSMGEFEKGVAKSHGVMQEFFSNESGAVVENMKKVDFLVKEVNKVLGDSGFMTFNELKEKIKEFRGKLSSEGDVEEKAKALKSEIKKLEESGKMKGEEILNLEKSEEYGDYVKLVEFKAKLDENIGSMEKEVGGSFSVIEASLKKYKKLNPEDKLVANYLDNFVGTLLKDSGLEFLRICGSIRNLIESGEIEIKDKKREKVLGELSKLDQPFLEKFLNEHEKLGEELDKVELRMGRFDVADRIENLKGEMAKDVARIKDSQGRLDKIGGSLSKEKLNDLKMDLESALSERTGVEVRIVD